MVFARYRKVGIVQVDFLRDHTLQHLKGAPDSRKCEENTLRFLRLHACLVQRNGECKIKVLKVLLLRPSGMIYI